MSCDLNLSDDQKQIIDAAQALLDENFPVSRLRQDCTDPLAVIAEFGGFSLALPENIGGAGFTLIEEALLHTLFGRHLISTRALATSIGARLAAEIGDNALAENMASGATHVCAAVESKNSLILFEPRDASHAVVWGAERLQLMDVTLLSQQSLEAMGSGRALSRATQHSQAIVGENAGSPLYRLADILISAQLLGIAEATRDLAVSYAGVREQFGRPIGSFQAIKHQCANMMVGTHMLSSLLDMAVIAEQDGREDAAFQTAALRRLAPKIALSNARQTIQIHGGIGFTAEADPHHFLKQTHILKQLGGARDFMAATAPMAPKTRT